MLMKMIAIVAISFGFYMLYSGFKMEGELAVKRKNKIIGLILIIVSLFILPSESKSEADFFKNIFEIQNEVEDFIAYQDTGADDARKQVIKFLDKSIKKLKENKPPSSLPKEVKEGYKNHVQGLTEVKKAYASNDIELSKEGGTKVFDAKQAYNRYLSGNPEIKEEIK